MDARGIVVLPEQGQVSSKTPGRSVDLKLRGVERPVTAS